MTVADRDRCSLLGILKAVATTIAADGGTINLRKLLGIGLGALEKCFFWKLITVKSTGHLHVSKHLESAVISLMSAMVWVIAIVGDNATAMQKGIRVVCKKFGLCALRCACHYLQLVVKDMRDIMPFVMQASRVHAVIMQRIFFVFTGWVTLTSTWRTSSHFLCGTGFRTSTSTSAMGCSLSRNFPSAMALPMGAASKVRGSRDSRVRFGGGSVFGHQRSRRSSRR